MFWFFYHLYKYIISNIYDKPTIKIIYIKDPRTGQSFLSAKYDKPTKPIIIYIRDPGTKQSF